ncbi:MAG: hypothetical protein AAGH70_02705 [Pseudomonadota bacterium]
MLAFIIALAAGFVSRMVKEPLVGGLESVLMDKIDISTEEALAMSYALCMLIAGVVIALSGSGVSAFVVLLGGLIGLFATEIYAAIRKAIG